MFISVQKMNAGENYEYLKVTINVVNRRCGLGLKNLNGEVIVSKLMENSAAAEKLKVGDVLLSINGETFKDKVQCRKLILKTSKIFDIVIKRKNKAEVATTPVASVSADANSPNHTEVDVSSTAVESIHLDDDQPSKPHVPIEEKEAELKPNWDNLPSDVRNILNTRLQQFEIETQKMSESPATLEVPVSSSAENRVTFNKQITTHSIKSDIKRKFF
ncbi:hypothetical protein T4E_5259 [Trichinella pseudospiralis]|uniref:PDZ domain-containing protein n=2 Tax=Trichinella pseudospiralis TaxID=6337 RepID=A0A0V0YAR3_TRIPS|nr:hypothetical protein T4E_5259 [Trichinella pseudospiralis]